MKRFPFRAMFLCIFFPPICYALTLQGLGLALQEREIAALDKVILRNPDALYRGHYTVKDEVNRNIREYLGRNLWTRLGLEMTILVKTKKDRILYPSGSNLPGSLSDRFDVDFTEIASENFQVLNEGITAAVNLHIRHNSWLANIILLFYVSISAWILTRAVKARVRDSEEKDAAWKETVERLSSRLLGTDQKLQELEVRETDYRRRIEELQKEKQILSCDVDGLLDEIEKQEAGLVGRKQVEERLESEVHRLRQELDRVKERIHHPKMRRRAEAAQKRLRVLYKNVLFTDRAIDGLLSLTDEQQLKAEELVHKLNGHESGVNVRRKVFGRGGKVDVLEAEFSYSGRLYFQTDHKDNRIRIIAVGTKNSQERDLAYIENAQ
jgi:hypothetical protein